MKRTLFLIAICLVASTAWGQQLESITLPGTSLAGPPMGWFTGPSTGVISINDQSALLNNCDTRILSAYPKDGKLEIVKEQRCHSTVALTYDPDTRKVWKEIYTIQGDKIGLQSTVEAKVIPAQDERVVWPDDSVRVGYVPKGDGVNTGDVTFTLGLPSRVVEGQFLKVEPPGTLSFANPRKARNHRPRRGIKRHYAHAQQLRMAGKSAFSRHARRSRPR